jgi:hypothetical protein
MVLVAASVLSPAIAVAQQESSSPPPATPRVAVSALASERDAEYSALARDVSALERELGIVKRVVKLVTPAVVHIEARYVPRTGARQIEEAGSGVIVEFAGKQYILTNRHVIGSSNPSRIDIHLPDGRSLYDLFGFEWTLLCLGKNKTPTLPESDTLNVLNLNSEEARDLYGADFVLIRPDQIVAWRGNAAAGAVAALKGITEA